MRGTGAEVFADLTDTEIVQYILKEMFEPGMDTSGWVQKVSRYGAVIKAQLDSVETARFVTKAAYILRRVNDFEKVYIHPDKTRAERDEYRQRRGNAN